MLFIDAGTSYVKISDDSNGNKIIPLPETERYSSTQITAITGHNAGKFSSAPVVNELVALAEGAKSFVNSDNYTVLDIGSRDMKLIRFLNNKFEKCDWNTSCGAMIGFTIDLITRYFNINMEKLSYTKKTYDITCGLLGITKYFDDISNGTSIEEGISSLLRGMAKFSWQFAGQPDSLYLSGGLSDNKLFIKYLSEYISNLHVLGRFVLLEGLKNICKNKKVKQDGTIIYSTGY